MYGFEIATMEEIMHSLHEKVAVVTGASRGVGQGITLGLGEAGAIVYVTGRTVEEADAVEALAGTIHSTAAEVTKLGGHGIAVYCDHGNDAEVAAVFQQVLEEQGRIDILVNNVWAGYEHMVEDNTNYTWENPFWEQPLWRWEAMFQAGVRAHFVASQYAARQMIKQRSGLIVNISYWAAQKNIGNTIYGVAKAATDRMAQAMAYELRDYNVAAVSLYPGIVRTERVMRAAEFMDLSNSESPQFVGRAVAALAGDEHVIEKSGQVLVAAALAKEYEFTDIDGKQPRPLTLVAA
jgi:NAD(P)-dependent dehydrogenase (short-subunit alcohol dehydrogenase family)